MMKDSLFISAAFIVTETSFFLVASFAAYELLIGDFVWAQQEEARRQALKQGSRGRGDATFDSRRLQQQLQGQHRSLSPGGRGPASRGGAYYTPSGRGSVGPSEETALLYSQPRSREGSRERRMVAEKVHYASPGDTRFASPGRGSAGDSTRRTFYKVILLALISRLALLPVETYCLSLLNNSSSALDFLHAHLILYIILRISQTLPDIAFASAMAFLIIFCAKIAFSAMPPLSPEPCHEDIMVGIESEVIDDGMMQRDESVVEGSARVQAHDIEHDVTSNKTPRERHRVQSWITSAKRLSRTILASEETFVTWNIIIWISYALIFITALAVPNAKISSCEKYLWVFLAITYSLLLLTLAYAATLLGTSLFSGSEKRKYANSLAGKLVGTCTLLAIMLISQAVSFSLVAYHAIVDLNSTQHEGSVRSRHRKVAFEYVVSESLPILFILFMMHRKRKEVSNDVFIHSILNNLFGSSGKLSAPDVAAAPTVAPSSSAENFSAASTERHGHGLGSRRFQTYGGTRVDSFPPSSFKARLDNPREFSSDSKV